MLVLQAFYLLYGAQMLPRITLYARISMAALLFKIYLLSYVLNFDKLIGRTSVTLEKSAKDLGYFL